MSQWNGGTEKDRLIMDKKYETEPISSNRINKYHSGGDFISIPYNLKTNKQTEKF
jgi:hypothetical protein